VVYAKGSAIIGKHKSIQCPLDPVFQCTPLSKSYEFSKVDAPVQVGSSLASQSQASDLLSRAEVFIRRDA